MKALSLWQPWASAVVAGCKHYETRSWSTTHRGKLAIHAAKKKVDPTLTNLAYAAIRSLGDPAPFWFPRGCVIGVVDLVDVLEITAEFAEGLSAHERALGDWTPGRFAWKFENVRQLDVEIPLAGRQALFDVPDALVGRAVAQTRRRARPKTV